MIYFFVFILSLLFIRTADFFKKDPPMFWFLTFLGLIIPIILYAARDDSVGFDVELYVKPFFQDACKSASFSQYRIYLKTDILYQLINYIVSRFTHDIFWLHFVIQLIIIGCVYYCSYSYRKRFPIWFPMLLYFALMYCTTMNIVRQSIAVAISLVSVNYYLQDKKIKSYITFVIAILAHPTAIICLLFYAIHYILQIKKDIVRRSTITLFILIIILFIYEFQSVISFILNTGGEEATRYSIYATSDEFRISKFDILIKLSVIAILFYGLKLKVENDINIKYFILIAILSLLFIFLNLVASKAGRFSMYFQDISFISLPLVLFSNKISLKIKYLLLGTLIILLAIAFYSMIILKGDISGNLYPYKISSKVLNYFPY